MSYFPMLLIQYIIYFILKLFLKHSRMVSAYTRCSILCYIEYINSVKIKLQVFLNFQMRSGFKVSLLSKAIILSAVYDS